MIKIKALTTIAVLSTLLVGLTACTGEENKTSGDETIPGKTYSLTDTVNLTASPVWDTATTTSLNQKDGWEIFESSNGASTGTDKSVSNSFLAQKETCTVSVVNTWQTIEGSQKSQAFDTEAFLYQIADNSPNSDAVTTPADPVTIKMGEKDGLELMTLEYTKEVQLSEEEFTPTNGMITGRTFNSIAEIDGLTVNEAVFIQYECQDGVELDSKIWDTVIADASLKATIKAEEK